jgi:uncharacterized protein YndB with AHSA1/START domain
MPSFRDSITAAAPPEEVWKILYDPARFPEWLAGVETVEPGAESADPDAAIGFTIYPARRPDFPMPHRLQAVSEDRRVVISCLITDLLSVWQLEPLEGGTATRISVHVDIPASRGGHYVDTEREVIAVSLSRLATLAFNTSQSS